MCFALYIGTDEPLPITEWSDKQLRSYFSELKEKDELVKDKFTKPYIYYAGSWQGCGCGWFSSNYETEQDKEFLDRTKQCIIDLNSTIERLLTKNDKVELFLCWEGSQGEQPKQRIVLSLDDLKGDSLPMEELDFAEVGK